MHLVILLYALFATIFGVAKTSFQYVQPFFLVGSRMLFAGAVLLIYHGWRTRGNMGLSQITRPQWVKLFLLGLSGIYLTNALEFWGLQYLTTFKTCFIYSLSPFVSALLSYAMYGERLTGKKWIGLVVGFAGFTPILMGDSPAEEALGHLMGFSWAEAAVIVAAVATVYGWILMRDLAKHDGFSPILINGLAMVMGGIMSLINSSFVENWNPLPVTHMGLFIQYALLMVIISNFICYNLYGHLLRKYTATFLAFAGFTTPIFTALFGWLFLDEVITWNFVASVAIVFSALLLFYVEELKEGMLQEQEEEAAELNRPLAVGE